MPNKILTAERLSEIRMESAGFSPTIATLLDHIDAQVAGRVNSLEAYSERIAEKKKELNDMIAERIADYQDETGTRVVGINLTSLGAFGKAATPIIEVEVAL